MVLREIPDGLWNDGFEYWLKLKPNIKGKHPFSVASALRQLFPR